MFATSFVLLSVLAFLFITSARPLRGLSFRRLLADSRGGPGDGDGGKPFSFASKEEFESTVMNMFSSTFNAKMKQFKKETTDDVLKEMNKGLTEFGSKLEGKFGELNLVLQNKRDKKGAKNADGTGGGNEPDDDPVVPPQLRTLQKKVEELENTNKAERERANQAEAKRRSMVVRSRLREVLESNGVTNPHKIKGVTAIFELEKKVDFSETFEDAAFLDTDGAPIDLEQGVRTWLATEEGEYYKDPSGAAGAGTRPGKRNGAADQQRAPTKAEIGVALLNSWTPK